MLGRRAGRRCGWVARVVWSAVFLGTGIRLSCHVASPSCLGISRRKREKYRKTGRLETPNREVGRAATEHPRYVGGLA